MNFVRWLVLDKMRRIFKPEDLFVTMFLSVVLGGFITAISWPYMVPVYLLVIFFWATVGYVHLERVWKSWREEYAKNK